ncbi:lipoprotein [Aliikangiella maris]|uniref:Lipoprotein n=2 Tax=Aliikangiella maris TaxID=3162458 RepID=A0ABV3MQE6_9GAMM
MFMRLVSFFKPICIVCFSILLLACGQKGPLKPAQMSSNMNQSNMHKTYINQLHLSQIPANYSLSKNPAAIAMYPISIRKEQN